MRALLAEGADVDQRARGGQTALMVAAIFSHVDVARLLLAAGADVRLQDNLGLTAREWADRRGSSEVSELLSNALPEETIPRPKNALRKQAPPNFVEAERRDPPAEAMTTPRQNVLSGSEEQLRRSADQQRREAEEERRAPATEAKDAPQDDAFRWMKFHKQIMADQDRRNAGEMRQASPTETEIESLQDAPSKTVEQRRTMADPQRNEVDEVSRYLSERGAVATWSSTGATRSETEQERQASWIETKIVPQQVASSVTAPLGLPVDGGEHDTTLERRHAELSTPRAMLEPKTWESVNPPPIKRCPKCNTTYGNALLMYCAYDATKLIGVDDSLFGSRAANDWARPTLWAFVVIIAGLGASLGYLINNYRSKERTSSAPIAAQTERPENASKDVPMKEPPFIDGELSGMEINVPEPEYPAQAKSEGVSGTVTVRVQVNEKGRVILVRSSKGDWRLRAAAVAAAQKATFSPEKLAVQGGVVSGTITYTFEAQTESPVATGLQAPTQTNPPSANGSSSASGSAAKVGEDYPVVGGPLVGAESNLPRPDYPETAKSKGISGTITVTVRVNRAGKVISWRTSKGDSQLRAAALKAAKKATFSPEKLVGRDEVVGTITYNFKR